MAAPKIDAPAYRALIKDLFLLPDLPEEIEDEPFLDDLPKLINYALSKCEDLFPDDCHGKLRQCRKSINSFLGARANTNHVNEHALLKLLKSGSAAPIPLYLRHHNAGILIRWSRRHYRIEAFQLSPKVSAVTSTVGRLRRKFPEISVIIEKKVAADEDFAQFIAETMAEMDSVEVPGLKPTRTIKGKKSEDKWDATLCDHIFDVFFPYLLTEKSSTHYEPRHASIVKHTRDYVLLVDDTKAVVRRSPIWLLLKVVLQQELRHENGSDNCTLYKQFMLVFFSVLLDGACALCFDSPTLHCMARKIGYRTWKLQDKASGLWMETVDHAVKKTNNILCESRKKDVQADQTERAVKLTPFVSSATNCHIQHSMLDQFMAKVRESPPEPNLVVVDPKSDIISWPKEKLPNIHDLEKEPSESDIFNLIKVEQWVEDYLPSFVEASKNDLSTCSDIKKFAIAYFKRARALYKDYPDHMSIMYLTMLELWVACDKCAVARNPLLQEYSPLGVEELNWEPLILRTRREMFRLSRAEHYLRERSSDKLSMISHYGKADCFASRFARDSTRHQMLMTMIENDMAKLEQEKFDELNQLKSKQKLHLDAHEKGKCDPNKCRVGTSTLLCTRCSHLAVACGMTIYPLQKTLPDNEDLSYSIAFELQVPADISAWRDFCFFLQQDVAGYTNPSTKPEFVSYIKNYTLLQKYFNAEVKGRIILASTPAKGDDIQPVPVSQGMKLSDVCRTHPMRWRLFDSGPCKYIKTLDKSDLIDDVCTINIGDENQILQRIHTDCYTQNELIAMRLEAENTIMLKHNEELGSLVIGHYATWPKILRELRGTSIDWTAPETFLLITDVALKAGQKQVDGELRQRHYQLRSEEFSTKFLVEILRLLKIYTASFSGRRALAVFCTIAIKIITEAPNSCHAHAFEILKIVRNTCFDWLRDVSLSGVDVMPDMLETRLDLALICAYTFVVDDQFLKGFLSCDGWAYIYVFASMIIQEGKSKVVSPFQAILYSAWQRLAVNASWILEKEVANGNPDGVVTGMRFGLGMATNLKPDEARFSHVSGPWVKTYTKARDWSTSKTMHLNLMTGEVLIDGKSPRYLSASYLEHEDFRALFGDLNPAVTPLNHPIYDYQFRHSFKGFNIEVGIEHLVRDQDPDKCKSNLHVRAMKGSATFVLTPRHILALPSFPFPQEYLGAYLHWHQVTGGVYQIDFYPCHSPWDSSSIAWGLKSEQRGWLLKKQGGERVVMPTSLDHYSQLSNVFQYFTTEDDFRVILNSEKNILEVHLGTLGLNFCVDDGSSAIRSLDYEDMYIDHEYSLETLIGLKPKLILRNQHDNSRTLLVADGEVECLRTRDRHSEVTVKINNQTTIQAYSIDENLKQLRGNHTWRGKAYLAYLFALTSHCLPDPFTSETGQEAALSILTSGAIMSFDRLDPTDLDLLEKIRKLSPERQVRKRPGANLPIMIRNDRLHPIFQHEDYFFEAEKIFEHARTLSLLRNDSRIERQKPSETEILLRESDAIRFACFRATGYNTHNDSRDRNYYFRMPETKGKTVRQTEPMDYGKSDRFQRAYLAALGAKYHQRYSDKAPSPHELLTQMTKQGATKGVTDHYDADNFRYMGKWLDPEESTLVQDLCSIHKVLTAPMPDRNPYRLRLWLSTVACGMKAGVADSLVPILIALINKKSAPVIEIPTTTNLNLSLGCEYSADQIATILNDAKTPFVPLLRNFDDETEGDVSMKTFHEQQRARLTSLAEQMAEVGPVSLKDHSRYLDVQSATESIRVLFRNWDLNKKWISYCENLCLLVSSLDVSDVKPPALLLTLPDQPAKHRSGHITIEEMMKQVPKHFSSNNQWRDTFIDQLQSHMKLGERELRPALANMPSDFSQFASEQHEKDYYAVLDSSIQAFKKHRSIIEVENRSSVESVARSYKYQIERRLKASVEEAGLVVRRVAETDPAFSSVIFNSDIFPHVSLRWFLRRLSFGEIAHCGPKWLDLIQQIAALCRDRQHMDRIIKAVSNEADLLIEMQAIPRYTYNDSSFPDAVLLEIEQDVCLRENQLETALQMRGPPREENAVMQLNMGEGKSSIIIPILSASLAEGKTLVRVFTGRHQFEQMRDTMTAAMGGLMNRAVFCMPYNRDSKVVPKDIRKLKELLNRCARTGGVLLLQPEHHLSLLLSTCLNEDTSQTKNNMGLLKHLKQNCRDIIDECDEILSPTYELLYTIGTPGPVDFAPDRWLFIQGLLELLKDLADPKAKVITEKQILYQHNPKHPDAYPTFNFLSQASLGEVLTEVGRHFVINGITGFPVNRYSGPMKRAIKVFITTTECKQKYVKKIEKLGQSAKSGLALVRGCITGDIFRVALLRKRWRVDYGCDFQRIPSTRLAVPFAAKDVPKPRAEFSNTDLVILFTQLSFYQSGLREQDVRELIEHMLLADDGHDIYSKWFKSSTMPQALRELKAVNLQDAKQFNEDFFPNIRYSVQAINHFLSRLVFPTELSAFSQHMAASGWDLAEKTAHPTTGFSGTTDLCALLPLGMKRHDLPSQSHTNALVLNNILHDENTVLLMHGELEMRSSDGSDLIKHVIKDGRIRVILDVGAQVIRLSNKQVAETWLELTTDKNIKAVVFFNDSDVLSVIDRNGIVTALRASVFARKLDACAVFLDEAHTRGTDLRLPTEYKAAVTLGPGLTKDRLAQACMRMRNLGKGQTLVFYVSYEIENDIRNLLHMKNEQPLTIDRIIQWTISQTLTSITRQMPYWAKQGCRHKQQSEKSYAPRPPRSAIQGGVQSAGLAETETEADLKFYTKHAQFINTLNTMCSKFGFVSVADDLDETCEREVAPEVEDEKQVSKPPKPEAADSNANNALERFITHGEILKNSTRLEWAFESLHQTTLAPMLKQLNFPQNLLVTRGFANAVKTDDHTDQYQHHVVYVLHIKPGVTRDKNHDAVIIISQDDLERYWEMIEKSKMVSLHSYNAKVTLEGAHHADYIYPLDVNYSYMHPTETRIMLDLFAGQLYFGSYNEYLQVSSFLGLAYFDETDCIEVEPDGFIPPLERDKIPPWHRHADQYWDTFETSPVPFFKHFLCVVRGHGASIEHTHMGRILDGGRLGVADFPDTFRPRGPNDVEGAVEEKKPRLETKAQRDERVQTLGKRVRAEAAPAAVEVKGEPVAKKQRVAPDSDREGLQRQKRLVEADKKASEMREEMRTIRKALPKGREAFAKVEKKRKRG